MKSGKRLAVIFQNLNKENVNLAFTLRDLPKATTRSTSDAVGRKLPAARCLTSLADALDFRIGFSVLGIDLGIARNGRPGFCHTIDTATGPIACRSGRGRCARGSREGAPDEFAVPAGLVPGAVGILAALPAPLGSFDELFRPPALAGPLGTPLTPAVPAPAEPALGEPAAVPVPADGPLAAPPATPGRSAPPPEPPPTLRVGSQRAHQRDHHDHFMRAQILHRRDPR